MARPLKPVDENLLRKLAAIHCNQDEMASVLGVSVDTLHRRFAEQIKDARNEGKMSLRRKMWEMALGGNVTILIWLSKNELGMTDKVEQKTDIKAEFKPLDPKEIQKVLASDPFLNPSKEPKE
jgi:AraC-like DNA-binding protein